MDPEKLQRAFRKPKKVREKSRECHNHIPQPFPDPKRKRRPTNPNKPKSNKRTKSTKIISLFPNRGNCNTKRTEKHKNKMTHGKTYNKSPRKINHKATTSKTDTGTTALERSEGTLSSFRQQYKIFRFLYSLHYYSGTWEYRNPIFTGIYRNPISITEIQLYYQVYHDMCKFRYIHC